MVPLTDRGSEFIVADAIEIEKMGQKGSLENNYIELRYICPSGTNLRELGLWSQHDMNMVISHINSSPKEKLNGKSPIEFLEFLNPSLFKKFIDFGITKIDKDKVN